MHATPAAKTLEATILEIQRLSTEDGPGLRTTVFFKGCSLFCEWCHNPESIKRAPEVQWIASRCIGCRHCMNACAQAGLSLSQEGLAIDRARCIGCGSCAEACPTTAMELLGQRIGLTELLGEVQKDKAYFTNSKQGGITASGGEAALQAEFVAAFFAALSNEGLHTALDTCGEVPTENLRRILEHTDLVLYDLKHADSAEHKRYTGHDFARIRENFAFVMKQARERERPLAVWVRTPIIPGRTDSVENLRKLGAWLAPFATHIERWELCAFNNLCKDKYRRLGLDWPLKDAPLITEAQMNAMYEAAISGGMDADKVRLSGALNLDAPKKDTPEPSKTPLGC